MKLAVVAKGGVGKTALCALLVRVLSIRGWKVLSLDLDRNPGLAVSLGISVEDIPLPDEAVEERPGTPYGWALADGLTPSQVVDRYATPVGDGVAFLGHGNISEVEKSVKRYATAILQVARGFNEPGWAVVGDLEAGPTTPFEGYARFASRALVVTEATPASALAARRILSILAHEEVPASVVVTKARGPDDVRWVEERVGPVLGHIPYDPELRRAELTGSLASLSSASLSMKAVVRLVERIEAGSRHDQMTKEAGEP